MSQNKIRAEDEAQTRDPQLGRLMLYQLSYFRSLHTPKRGFRCQNASLHAQAMIGMEWAKMDSNHRRYKPADLQSAPFGHSGIRPYFLCLPPEDDAHKENFYHSVPEGFISILAPFSNLEPLVGFEPTTPRLQITCSGQLS